MDRESSHSDSGRGDSKSRHSSPPQPGGVSGPSAQDINLIAQLAAAAGYQTDFHQLVSQLMPPSTQVSANPAPGFYNISHNMGAEHPHSPPLSSTDFCWSHLLAQQQGRQPLPADQHLPGVIPTISPMLFHGPAYNVLPPLSIDNPGLRQSPTQPGQSPLASTSASSPPAANTDTTDTERLGSAQEKRQRNTAASARFRIKKKQRTINLERSVSDLTGRAEELEREVTDLRRENSWLKEIVMLKGSHFAVANVQQRLALSQAVQAAGINLLLEPVESARHPVASSSARPPSNADGTQEEEPSDEDHEGTDKGKGKAPAVKRRGK